MDELLTIPRPAMRARGPQMGPAIVIGLVVVVLLVVTALAVRPIDTVSVTVDNPTDWRAEVSVRSASSSSWTGLGAVDRESEVQFLEVPDQGASWVVRFSYAGQSEEIEVDRAALRDGGWKVDVPDALAEALADEGVPPTIGRGSGG
ncbi:MAG TPA: hypothetical protein VIY72_16410 [Acidimicrobiales bacterium]